MKKLLVAFICVFTLISCQDSDLLTEDQKAVFEEADSAEATTRTIGFMDPSNQIPLYEYTWNNMDYYYASQFLGATFYDSKTSRTYQYVRQFGKLGKDLYPYYGHISIIEKLALYYNPTKKTHRVVVADAYNPDQFSQDDGHTVKVRELGWMLWQIHTDDRYHLADGSWKYFYIYQHRTTNVTRLDYSDKEDELRNEWKWIRILGYCIIR